MFKRKRSCILAAECQKKPVDVVFVFDSSQSVEEVFEQQKQIAERLISHLNIDPFGSLVGLVEYSRYNKLLLPISTAQHIDQVKEAFHKLRHIGGYTLTADAVKTGVEEIHQGGRPGAEKLFVLITDGHSFNKWSEVLETADSLHNTGAKVIIIALADSLYMPELIEYGGPRGIIFTKQNVSQVDSVFIDLTSNGCNPEPSGPSSDEDCAADILFILDGSGNASDSFEAKKQFVKSMINELTIRPSAHRVALIEFSDINRQKELFNFASYSDKASLLNAVDTSYEPPEEEYEPEKVAEGNEAQSLAVHKVAAPFPKEDLEKYYEGATGKGSCDETNGPSNVIILLDSSKSIRSVESRREAAMQLIFKLLNGHLNVQVTVAQHPSLQESVSLKERLSSYADNCQIKETKPGVTRKSASVVYITSESTAESLAANLSHISAPNLKTYFLTTDTDDSTSTEIRRPSKSGLIFSKCNVGALYEALLKNASCLPN
ncbi:VWA domain containing protein [Trichuris trichiura]|uniref:VWA domain containing protein n=1 Tax=Trichuris trichiura TaxID=36087 RepID=A0A077Z2K2_TRITR|nr:VWA domain containing protein [Trichuris trichiura]